METISALPVICVRNSTVTGDFPAQRPVTRNFDVFFDLRLNKRFSKQSWGWWFETPSRPLWRHSNADFAKLIFDDQMTSFGTLYEIETDLVADLCFCLKINLTVKCLPSVSNVYKPYSPMENRQSLRWASAWQLISIRNNAVTWKRFQYHWFLKWGILYNWALFKINSCCKVCNISSVQYVPINSLLAEFQNRAHKSTCVGAIYNSLRIYCNIHFLSAQLISDNHFLSTCPSWEPLLWLKSVRYRS